jgi:hypothetical protein
MRRRIELVDVVEDGKTHKLPRFPEDDADFVAQRLGAYAPCTVPTFMKRLGIEARPFGNPGKLYNRMLAAFRRAKEQGKIDNCMNGRTWRVVVQSAKAS